MVRIEFRPRIGAIVVAALAGVAPAWATLPTYRIVALTNVDNAYGPGQGAGLSFSALGQQQPTINYAGQVAFRGTNSAPGASQGVWISSGGLNSNVATGGGAQPGGGTYPTGSSVFNSTAINRSGNWAFRTGAGTGLFSDSGGGPGRVMLTLDTAPGTGGATYSSVASGTPFFNNAGQTGYIANLTTSTGSPPVVLSGATANSQGLWIGTPGAGNQSLALRQNDAVTSLDAGGNVRVGTFSNLSMAMNGNGRFAVTSALQGSVTAGTGAGTNASMISTNRGGSLEVIARVGNAAPDASGLPSATDLFRSFGTGAIGFNDNGRVAFSSSLRNAAGTQTFAAALFSDVGTGALHMLARTGDALPAVANANGAEFAGVTWGSSFGTNMSLNSNDVLAFIATGLGGATSATNGAVFTMSPLGSLVKIERNGDVAIPGGAPDGTDARFLSVSNLQVNSRGEVAFQASLTGNQVSVGLGNGSALFATDPYGALVKIARTGDLFEAAPGDFRTIASIGGVATSGGQDGRLINFNDRHELSFELDFTNGTSGIYVAQVPEPAALGLLLLGVVALRRR